MKREMAFERTNGVVASWKTGTSLTFNTHGMAGTCSNPNTNGKDFATQQGAVESNATGKTGNMDGVESRPSTGSTLSSSSGGVLKIAVTTRPSGWSSRSTSRPSSGRGRHEERVPSIWAVHKEMSFWHSGDMIRANGNKGQLPDLSLTSSEGSDMYPFTDHSSEGVHSKRGAWRGSRGSHYASESTQCGSEDTLRRDPEEFSPVVPNKSSTGQPKHSAKTRGSSIGALFLSIRGGSQCCSASRAQVAQEPPRAGARAAW